jgi:hypothetical protein
LPSEHAEKEQRVDMLVALIGWVLSGLHAWAGAQVCPGDWAWTVTGFGVLVGLLPTCGAVAVAVLRRRAAPPLGGTTSALVGVLSSGLLVWAVFNATGQVFRSGMRALGPSGRATLSQVNCLGVTQRAYLGTDPVSGALSGGVLRSTLFFFPLAIFPLFAALFVGLQARLALRRGPRWPARFFWLSLVVVAVLTGPMPAGSTAQLWTGVVFGSMAGVVVVLLVPPPARVPAPAGTAPPTRAGQFPPASRPNPPRRATNAPVPRSVPASRSVLSAGSVLDRVTALAAATGHWLAGSPARMGARLAATPGPLPVLGAGAVIPAPRLPATLVERPAERGPVPGARFELRRRLGVGGFGGVWLAMDHRMGRLVALKAATVADHDAELRLRREARALGSVEHPHCVRILDLVDSRTDPGLAGQLRGLVIVMEYVDGRSLDEVVATHGPADDVTAARIWRLMASALEAAHQRGVLHRDVKPGNVVLDPAGEPHLIDFGIARARGDATLTMTGMVIGTPDFLAPEVARGEPATPASDCWQLAATISFALTGYPPRGDHADAVSGLRAAAAATVPRHLPVHSAHCRMIRACLAADPAARPSLSTVRRTLDGWLTAARAG